MVVAQVVGFPIAAAIRTPRACHRHAGGAERVVETGRVGVAAGVIRAGVVAVATDGETVGVAAWVGGELVVWVGNGVVAVVVDASGTGVGVRAVACTGELATTPAQMAMATPMACLPLTHVEGHRVVTIAVTPERGLRGG